MTIDEPLGEPRDDPNEAHGATTLIEALAHLREAGYSVQWIAQDDGSVRCTGCDASVPATDLDVEGFLRLEGASDPSDENIVVWGTCRECSVGGAATLGFGPNATDADQAVLDAIDLRQVSNDGALPGQPG